MTREIRRDKLVCAKMAAKRTGKRVMKKETKAPRNLKVKCRNQAPKIKKKAQKPCPTALKHHKQMNVTRWRINPKMKKIVRPINPHAQKQKLKVRQKPKLKKNEKKLNAARKMRKIPAKSKATAKLKATGHARPKKTVAKGNACERKERKQIDELMAAVKPGMKNTKQDMRRKLTQEKPIGVVTYGKDKWVLTVDFSDLAVRQVKVFIADRKVEVRGLYRAYKNVWKNINENYTIPEGYPCVVHNNKNGVWTIVARDCKGKCTWHRPEWPFPDGFKWPWDVG